MLQQYGNCIQLLHLKDRKAGFPTSQVLATPAEHFTEVGADTIRWREILAAAEKNGVKHFYVERDSEDLPAMESLRVSFQNLQKIG
jgi:sugar phosphate isomerase/epimerase